MAAYMHSGQRSNRTASELPRVNHPSERGSSSDQRAQRFPQTSNTTLGSSLPPLGGCLGTQTPSPPRLHPAI